MKMIPLRMMTRSLAITALAIAMTSVVRAKDSKTLPVQIYLLVGQSNMQGKAPIEGDTSNSLRHMVKNDPKKEFQALVDDDGEWVARDDVWIHYDLYPFQGLRHGVLKPGYGSSSGQIGPEFGFGQVIGDASQQQVLLIKAAWGGKSLAHNFQSPSIGKYPRPVQPDDPGYFYHQTLQLVREVTQNIESFFPDYQGQGMEIAGLGWHQGWNDQYGDGNPANYERNLAAFITDIRSAEHGLGIANLPVVIATSGNIDKETPIKDGQLAMADAAKYPEFAGNVAVVDTDTLYGPDKMGFRFFLEGKPEKVGYHWNSHARSYYNIGRAMAMEMRKLDRPKLPSRLTAHGTAQGVRLNWQLGSETPTRIEILRNGKRLDATLAPTQTEFVDTRALPGANSYEFVLTMPSGKQTFRAACDTSVTDLSGYRSLDGVVLSWEAQGKYEAFRISRDAKVIADAVAADRRSFEDKTAPTKGKVTYAVQPTTGKVTPAEFVANLGPVDAGGALVYEPFDYPASEDEVQVLNGKSGAIGTKGGYVYLREQPGREPATMAKSLKFGDLPVTGNSASTHRWSDGAYIELDDSLKKAGLLEDGATMWLSYVFIAPSTPKYTHRSGGGSFTLRSADLQVGVGLRGSGRQYETVVVMDGTEKAVRITGTRPNTAILVVARITWGKNGENDSIVPFHVGPDLTLPEKEGRHFKPPVNIDQSKISRLVLHGEGQFDEIRIGPSFESVVGLGSAAAK